MAGADLGTLTAKLQLNTSGAESAIGKLKGLFGPVGDAAAALGAAILAVGGTAAALATKFQASTDLMAAQAGISASAASKIGDAFLATGGKVDFSAQQMIEALGPVSGQLAALMGHALSSADDLTVMKAAMDGASATGQDLNSVTAALANTLVAFNLSTASSSLVMDTLFNASRILNQPISDIAATIDKLHGKLGEATPPLQQVAALMVDLAANGVPARQAVSGLSGALIALIDPSKAQKKVLDDLKFSALTSTGQFKGMDAVIAGLGPKFAKMTAAQQLQTAVVLFGKPAAEAMLSIIAKGPAAFDAHTAAVGKAGSAQSAATVATTNLEGAFNRAFKAVQDFLTLMGEKLTPFLTDLVGFFTSRVLPAIEGLVPSVEKFGAAVYTWFVQTAIPALEKFGGFVETNAVAPLLSLASWIYANVLPALEGIWTWINTKVIPKLVDLVSAIRTDVLPALADMGTWVWNNVINPLLHLTEAIIPPLLGALTFVVQHFSDVSAIVLPIAAALAGVWAVGKIQAWSSAALGAIKGVLGQLGIVNAASSISGSGVGIQQVYVTNWEQIASGDAAGGGVGAAEGAGIGTEAAGAGATGKIGDLALQIGLVATAAVGINLAVNALLEHSANNGKGFQFEGFNAQQLQTGQGAGNKPQSGWGFLGIGVNPLANAQLNNQQLIKAQADIAKIAASLDMTVPQYINFETVSGTLGAMVGKTAPEIGSGFSTLLGNLLKMTGNTSLSVDAVANLQAYITKYGPLTSVQMLAFYNDISNGVANAFDIALSLQTVNENLNPAIQSAADIASALAALHKHLPKTINLPGGGLGSLKATAGGGFFNSPTALLVGEAGPELVLNRSQFRAMMGGGNPHGSSTINVTVNANTNASASDIARQVSWALKTAAV